MIRTLDRYLLKSFLTNYVLSLFVMVSLYVVLDLFVNLDEFTEATKSVWRVVRDIANYYGYNLPLYFSQLSGVISLFAACGTFARLHRQNEVTAVLASGTSLYRLATPVILGALATNALLVVDQEFVLPRVAPMLVRERADVQGQKVKEVWCVRDGESRLISGIEFAPAQQRIRGMIILELETEPLHQGELKDVITADFGAWDAARQGWALTRGVRLSMTSGTAGTLGMDQAAERTGVDFYGTSITPEQLKLRQSVNWMQFLSLRQLRDLEKSGDIRPSQVAPIRHQRFTIPIHNMILVLLGLSFFMTRVPTSVLTQCAEALGVCALFFIVAFVSQQIGGSVTVLTPAVASFIPIFIFGPVSVLLLANVKT